MAGSERPGWRRDLLRPIDLLAQLWSTTTTIPPVAAGAAVAYRGLFSTVRRLVVGRTLAVRLNAGEITLTVTEFDSRLARPALAAGQLDTIRLVATDLRWDQGRLDRAVITLRNVRVRPGNPTQVVAGPVDMCLDVSAPVVDDLFRRVAPRFTGVIDADTTARLHWARRPALGNVEVDVRLDGSTLWLQPIGVTVRRRRWRVPAWMPARAVQLPDLPHNMQLTGIRSSPGALQVTGTLPEWRMELPRTGVEDILSQLNSVGRTLNLTKISRR